MINNIHLSVTISQNIMIHIRCDRIKLMVFSIHYNVE